MPVVLRMSETRRLESLDLTVTIEAVVEDSRCPEGEACLWAGDAAVAVVLTGATSPSTRVVLHTNLPSGRETTYQGVRVRLIEVAPRPTAGERPRAEQYRITLSFTKGQE